MDVGQERTTYNKTKRLVSEGMDATPFLADASGYDCALVVAVHVGAFAVDHFSLSLLHPLLMIRTILLSLFVSVPVLAIASEPVRWSADSARANVVATHGKAELCAGIEGESWFFNGQTVLEPQDARDVLKSGQYSLVVWVNPHRLNAGQQIIAAKNRYSLGEREWSLMLDGNRQFSLYVYRNGWRTISGPEPELGNWYQLCMVMKPESAELYVNGERAGSLKLDRPVQSTDAPLTLGGVNDDGNIRQTWNGAIDEVQLLPSALSPEEVAASYHPVDSVHDVPVPPQAFPLWDENVSLGRADDLPEVANVDFHVIKKWDKPRDGYTFLHGVSLAWHKGKLFASIGHNKGDENTVTEEAQFRVSEDEGKTWGPLEVIDAGDEGNLAVSHGVFLSHDETLWAFQGAYYGRMDDIHTRAYRLNDSTGEWKPLGVIIEHGFWPMNQPVRMDDGNWIMPGFLGKRYSGDKVFPAAVAISHGNDFTRWDCVKIPVDSFIHRMWGESSLWVDGSTVFNVARYGGDAKALVSKSDDYGQTWAPSRVSNLPMATSKPAAGVLSNGQRYLVCTTAAANGGKRSPLTIAVSRPGENVFAKVFVIRRSMNGNAAGESAASLSLSYPCALEHDGKLYVGYSNNGGRRANQNSAELAVLPIESLQVP
ncbi:cycloinulo-oligosaccharide fructanotransferase [Rhodopirellula europaea 6C]|uniref:Cycloinulo-oligosaccharide fructanotransferase n=1 Tax=Rhodopirellula europaea 6C TaxID=1263867 RepID=M2B6J4_9BACT|nr:cycloinulo-oligosaccharide fructanotransferase [Rhodopirellula europaea 6C]